MASERRVANLSRRESYDSTESRQNQPGCWEEILRMTGQFILNASRLLFKRPRLKLPSKRSQSSLNDPIDTTSLQVFCCCCFNYVSKTRVFKILFKARSKIRIAVDSKTFQVKNILSKIFININNEIL